MESTLENENKVLFDKIVNKYNAYMEILSPLKKYPRAVQGDISECNLYLTSFGELGIFDFNRCGDTENVRRWLLTILERLTLSG